MKGVTDAAGQRPATFALQYSAKPFLKFFGVQNLFFKKVSANNIPLNQNLNAGVMPFPILPIEFTSCLLTLKMFCSMIKETNVYRGLYGEKR